MRPLAAIARDPGPQTRDGAGARAFAPATVSNLACGFDVLGLALEAPGDEVTARPSEVPGVRLLAVDGDGGRLPRGADENTCGIAASALLRLVGRNDGVDLELSKGLPLASGLGSSAASAVAAVVAVDAALGLGQPRGVLLRAALAAEAAACGSAHPDNAAPALYGGWVLARRGDPPDVVSLPVPPGLTFAVARPHMDFPTREGRRLLPESLPLGDAVTQSGNLGGLVAALFRGDLELLARCLEDVVAEPYRSPHIPGYAAVKAAAVEAGALGANLSGSGPSVFALCASRPVAETAAEAMAATFLAAAGLECQVIVSAVSAEGARLL